MKKPQIEPEWIQEQCPNKYKWRNDMCNLKEWVMSLLFYYLILAIGSMTGT